MQVSRPVIGQEIFFPASRAIFYFTVRNVKGDLLIMGEDSVMRLGGSERWLLTPSSYKFVGISGNRFFTTLKEALKYQEMSGEMAACEAMS